MVEFKKGHDITYVIMNKGIYIFKMAVYPVVDQIRQSIPRDHRRSKGKAKKRLSVTMLQHRIHTASTLLTCLLIPDNILNGPFLPLCSSLLDTLEALSSLESQLANVPALTLEVRTESLVFVLSMGKMECQISSNS